MLGIDVDKFRYLVCWGLSSGKLLRGVLDEWRAKRPSRLIDLLLDRILESSRCTRELIISV